MHNDEESDRDVLPCQKHLRAVQGTSMPINIPMMPGRSNPLTSEGNENLDVDFVPPHIMEQQKVSTVCCTIACLLHKSQWNLSRLPFLP